MIHGDLEDVEARKVCARPLGDGGAITDADAGAMVRRRRGHIGPPDASVVNENGTKAPVEIALTAACPSNV